MKTFLLFVLLYCSAVDIALGVDVCPSYAKIHEREVLPKIRSGIPFRLLGVAKGERATFKRMVRIEFDLWTEVVTLESQGLGVQTCPLDKAQNCICRALSIAETTKGEAYAYHLFLNPVVGEGLRKLQQVSGEPGRLIHYNWERLKRDLDTEKTLFVETMP